MKFYDYIVCVFFAYWFTSSILSFNVLSFVVFAGWYLMYENMRKDEQ